MTETLVKTGELKVVLGAPDRDTIIMNPHIGRDIELWKQQAEMHFYQEMDDFIEANGNYSEVTIEQENDFEKGAVRIKNKLNKAIGQPDTVKIFRKLDNLFFKPAGD